MHLQIKNFSEDGMSEKIAGDPNSFAGASEHSQQVALMAAVAHYAKYFREQGQQIQMDSLFWREDQNYGYASAQVMFDYGEALVKRSATLDWFHAIPNGGTRGADKRSAMIAGANMKAEGLKRGVYDTHLPVARRGYCSLWIEMKKPGEIKYAPDGSVAVGRNGKLSDGRSDEQVAYGEFIASEGSLGAVFDSWYGAMRAIMWYLDFTHCLAWELPG